MVFTRIHSGRLLKLRLTYSTEMCALDMCPSLWGQQGPRKGPPLRQIHLKCLMTLERECRCLFKCKGVCWSCFALKMATPVWVQPDCHSSTCMDLSSFPNPSSTAPSRGWLLPVSSTQQSLESSQLGSFQLWQWLFWGEHGVFPGGCLWSLWSADFCNRLCSFLRSVGWTFYLLDHTMGLSCHSKRGFSCLPAHVMKMRCMRVIWLGTRFEVMHAGG